MPVRILQVDFICKRAYCDSCHRLVRLGNRKMITITSINNRPRAAEPVIGFWQATASGFALVLFAVTIVALAAA